MRRIMKSRYSFKMGTKHLKIALAIEIIFTLSIAAIVVVNVWNGLYNEARQITSETNRDFGTIVDGYTSTFKTMIVPIKEKIEEDLSAEEMQTWLYGKEEEFTKAMGKDVYDGIAFTYKGEYIHSWNYGDYSNYDAKTRPWYKQAKAANGKVTVVAPYVTYLNEANLSDDEYILMTIAQKYNEDIYFDLDLKVLDISTMLMNTKLRYSNELIFLFDKEGYILSSTKEKNFAHNVYSPDKVISKEDSETFKESSSKLDQLLFKKIDGHYQYVYFQQDKNGNTACVMIPFSEVFKKNFLGIGIISLLLILFEIYIFSVNLKHAREFIERDRHLSVVSDTIYKERLYVDVDEMCFYGNDTAGSLCKNGTYDELYELIKSRLADKSEFEKLEKFLGREAVQNSQDEQYVIVPERFMMSMEDESGNMQTRTIEISKLAFKRNGDRMLAVAMRNAEESADLLKEALVSANQASVSKSNFLSNMSHEIRTPLNAIIGYITIAKDKRTSEEKKEYCIENCDIASRHLLQIINDILDMSSIENGKLKIANEEFDFKKEISELTTIFFQNAKLKNVDFETHIENLTEEWVVGDKLRLNQILMNLLSNAVKFTPEKGRVNLKIEQLREDDSNVYMRFTVSDTGIGMSEEYMTHLFSPFEQENATTARKFGGSGLGLSITKNLVQMMGGIIDVKSVQNEGTTFTVTLFFKKSKNDHQPVINTDYSHVRVLVVDDKEDECTYIKTMLKRCGVKADIATSGEKAIRQIKRRMGSDFSYDLCIIDWNMPEMNGGEVTKKIRTELGEEMPIIIATAYDITDFEQEAKVDGADKVVAKPLFQSTLFDLLVTTFGGYDPAANSDKDTEQINMNGVRILIAEDNPMNMDIAITILEKVGIKADQAVNGKEASELFLNCEEGTYDMILMDVQMPVMDGFEATKKIRNSNHPEAKTIPIIAMTANAFAEDVAEALSNGMDAHIAKPINYDKLFDLLKKYSKKHKDK